MDLAQHAEDEALDNPLRAIVVVNAPGNDGDMEERMLDLIQTIDEVNNFFDAFDDNVAYPNEGHLKYEVGSDGLVVVVADSPALHQKVLKYIDDYVSSEGTQKTLSKRAKTSGNKETSDSAKEENSEVPSKDKESVEPTN